MEPQPPADRLRKFYGSLAENPLQFVALCWPTMKLYGKQGDILQSLVANGETFVHAANELGKSRIAALAAIWFFMTRDPVRVVTSSSSEKQLKSILWTEINGLIRSSAIPFPLEIGSLKIEKLNEQGAKLPYSYMIGNVTSTVENFQGHHLPHDMSRVLAIFDEASAIADEFNEACDSWAHRKLVIGNPLSTTNFFYRLCKKGDTAQPRKDMPGLLRKVIHIDGLDSPNVQAGLLMEARGKGSSPPIIIPGLLSYTEYLKREQEWDEVQRTTRLHGWFYEGVLAHVFPLPWLDHSQEYDRQLRASNAARKAMSIGVDVAMGGGDYTVWTVVDELGVIAQTKMDISNTMETPGRTINMMKEYGVPANCVIMDAGGGGVPISDRMFELGHKITTVQFGGGAGSGLADEREADEAKKAFKNRRVEMYGHLRALLNHEMSKASFAIPCDGHELREELAMLPLQYDSEGKMTLPPKDKKSGDKHAGGTIKGMLGRSPDRADSLVLATWGLKTQCPHTWTLDPGKLGEKMKAAAETSKRMEETIQARMKDFAAKMRGT